MKLVVAGGGTGGHLFPGMAVAEAVTKLQPGSDVLFIGTERGLEARAVPARGLRLRLIGVHPIKGMGWRGALRGVASVPRAVLEVRRILAEERPDLVLGVGGYASGPAILAARTCGIPTAVLEQNAVPGLTNRLVGPLVQKAYVTFPESVARFPRGKAVVMGNPVRLAFAERAGAEDPGDGAILVFGGSQGARALNRLVPRAMKLAALARPIVHQTGKADLEEVAALYRELGVDADVRPFIDDMAGAVAAASLVICRAGATTLSELCSIGRASILVPFPYATDDHQTHNAASLQAAGASVMLPEKELTPERLAEVMRRLLADDSGRRRMARAALDRGRPGAAGDIARDLLTLLCEPQPEAMTEAASV
ncbi:MAG: undecaprenyldiphospho-muramoylpentapeptide beta-N-acetylglucosaminyltransferase [Deltaproteobacteria bacterium]|nr:undecaprenyldiphospho-muramoylpentapeptide beta-N-acetylglucosaminyltransferase [Deltaproteobacteria bacterium]